MTSIYAQYPDKTDKIIFLLVAGAQNSQFGIDSGKIHSGISHFSLMLPLWSKAAFFSLHITVWNCRNLSLIDDKMNQDVVIVVLEFSFSDSVFMKVF